MDTATEDSPTTTAAHGHTDAGSSAIDRIWLFLSGGGIRSGLGSLGTVFFLNDSLGEDAWSKVTRVSSVSGGSLENAALANSNSDMKTHFWHTFHRFTHHGGPHHYLPSIATFAIAVFVLRLLFWQWWTEEDSSWLTVVRVVAIILTCIAGIQAFASVYTRQRIGRMIVPPHKDPRPETCRPLLHIFSTADMKSGSPAYLITKNGSMVLAHDRAAVANQIDFYEAERVRLGTATYASSAWPFLLFPFATKLNRIEVGRRVKGTMNIAQLESAADDSDGSKKKFALMDGGLTGTLGSRLDGALHRVAGTGLMEKITWEDDDGQNNAQLLRIVIDGGRYLGITTTWWLAVVPGLSAFKTTHRSIMVSLDSQITVDRSLADRQKSVWYVPVTGHGRHFELPTGNPNEKVAVISVPTKDSLLYRLLRGQVGRRRKSEPLISNGHANAAEQIVGIVEMLKYEADRVGTFTGLKRRGAACGASGVAGAFVEKFGLGADVDELKAVLGRFEQAVVQKGRLDSVLGAPQNTSRWPDLEELYVPDADPEVFGPGTPFAMSHRGETTPLEDGGKVYDNTLPAFTAAYRRGFRVLECDVQATEHGELVALHGVWGWVKGRHIWSWRRISKMSSERASAHVGHRLDDVETLLASIDSDVTWNFEAKRGRSMDALLELLDRTELPTPPIISAGWRTTLALRARRNNTSALTAAGFSEVIRLTLRRSAPHVAVVQLDARLRPLLRYAARRARVHRIQVHWYNVNSKRRMERIRNKHPRDGINTNNHELLATVLRR